MHIFCKNIWISENISEKMSLSLSWDFFEKKKKKEFLEKYENF